MGGEKGICRSVALDRNDLLTPSYSENLTSWRDNQLIDSAFKSDRCLTRSAAVAWYDVFHCYS
jgi:hypothetical protein